MGWHCGAATSSRKLPAPSCGQPEVVWEKPSSISIRCVAHGVEHIHDVNLTLANVDYSKDDKTGQHIILVKPWSKNQQSFHLDKASVEFFTSGVMRETSNNCENKPEEAEIWIFLVFGNDVAAQAVLARMSQAGCARRCPDLAVERQIGAGACSKVYHAHHHHDEEKRHNAGCNDLALKVLKPNGTCSTSEEEFDSIRHEVTCLVHVGKHPNIIKFLGVFALHGEEEDTEHSNLQLCHYQSGPCPRWAFATEYLHCGDVLTAVSRERFREARARQVIADALSALAHIHRHGVVHRDVKAANLLFGKDGRAVLADFGMAAFLDDVDAMTKRCGSPGFTAPEVLPDNPSYGIKVDSFSAGVLLYFMICGHIPFEGRNAVDVLRKTHSCKVSFGSRTEFSQVSGQCKEFILQLLQKDPDKRLSAEQAVSQLWCRDHILDDVGNEDEICQVDHRMDIPHQVDIHHQVDVRELSTSATKDSTAAKDSTSQAANDKFDAQPVMESGHGPRGSVGVGLCRKFRQLISTSRGQNDDSQIMIEQSKQPLTEVLPSGENYSHWESAFNFVANTELRTSKTTVAWASHKMHVQQDVGPHTARPPSRKSLSKKPWPRISRISFWRASARNTSPSSII